MQPRRTTAFWTAAIIFAGLFSYASCKKEEGTAPRVLSPRDKILGTWRRSLRAYDRNGNRQIDSAEIDYTPATKATDTIILTLVPDATYTRSQVFKGVPYPENGTWHLQKSDAEIVMQPSTSTSRVDTFRIDTLEQDFFIQHRVNPGAVDYYESYVRPK